MDKFVLRITDKVLNGRAVSAKEAGRLYLGDGVPFFDLIWAANRIRERFKGDRVELCAIVNAKSGNCPQDCRFCAQSARHSARIDKYPLLGSRAILNAAKAAVKNKASCFGIVTSGGGITDKKEIRAIAGAIKAVRKYAPHLKCSVSLGSIAAEFISELKKAGLERFHHNLETSKRYFPRMCTTHTYQDRVAAVVLARKNGLEVCSGGIFGIGESRKDRLDLAFALRELDVESVPMNFLHPIKGTPLEAVAPIPPDEILRTIAIYRVVLPGKSIKVCGGRAVNLRALQPMIFFAGASGMMTGNYLTQPGEDPAADLEMLRDLGLRVSQALPVGKK